MKAQVQIEIGSFPVPDVVAALPFPLPPSMPRAGQAPQIPAPAPWVEGSPAGPSWGIPLRELDPLDLERMCDAFRGEVFRKAGKEQPPQYTAAPPDGGAHKRAADFSTALRNVVSAYDDATTPVDEAICVAVEAARDLLGL